MSPKVGTHSIINKIRAMQFQGRYFWPDEIDHKAQNHASKIPAKPSNSFRTLESYVKTIKISLGDVHLSQWFGESLKSLTKKPYKRWKNGNGVKNRLILFFT